MDLKFGKQRDEKLKEYSHLADAYLEYCGFLKMRYHSQMSKENIKKLRYEIAEEYLAKKIDYKPNAEKVLYYLKEKGFQLVIATTTNEHTIEIYKRQNKNIIAKANFEDIFSLIYAKSSVKQLKPHPEIYYKILKELKVKSEECFIIEDSLIGIEAANQANIEVAVIHDPYSENNRAKINQLSQYQFHDFEEMLSTIQEELEEEMINDEKE